VQDASVERGLFQVKLFFFFTKKVPHIFRRNIENHQKMILKQTSVGFYGIFKVVFGFLFWK